MSLNPALPISTYYSLVLINVALKINRVIEELMALFAVAASYHRTEEEISELYKQVHGEQNNEN